MTKHLWPTLAAAAAALALLVGCTADQERRTGETGDHAANSIRSAAGQNKSQNKDSMASDVRPAPEPKPGEAPPPKSEPRPAGTSGTAAVPSSSNVLYYPTGSRGTSLIMVEKTTPKEVVINQAFEYQIKVTNLTNNPLNNVVINETLPDNFTFDSSDPAAGGTGAARSFAIGDLEAGKSQTITIKGTAAGAGSLSSCCTVSAAMGLCATTNVVNPALSITTTAPTSVGACETIPVKIVVTNSGTGTARNVKVAQTFPVGLSADGKASLDWNVGSLGAGESEEINVKVKADKSGRYDTKATATGDNGLSATSNTATTSVTQPILSIKAECGPNVRLGQNTTCRFTVRNTGDGSCKDLKVTPTIPSGAKFVSADPDGSASGWNVGVLAPGESKTLSMTIVANNAGEFVCQATATCTCAPAVTDRCVTSAFGEPDIGTSLDDFNGVRNVGQNHDFTFVVKNQGQVDLTNVKVVFSPESGLDYVSTDWLSGAQNAGGGAGAGGAGGAGRQTVAIGTLRAGEQKTFKIIYKGTKAGQLLISAETTSDQTRAVRVDEQVNFVE